MTRADRVEVVRRLHAHGHTDGEIADRTGLSSRTAHRIRADLGLPAVDHLSTSHKYLQETS